MRPTCLNCARKHLAKALINMNEYRLGYPTFVWLAIGHLSEAEDELITRYPEQAYEIREHRKALEDDHTYLVPILETIDALTDLFDREVQKRNGDSDENVLQGMLGKGPL